MKFRKVLKELAIMGQSVSKTLLTRFVGASLAYFLVGTFWMATHRNFPAPTQVLPREIYAGQWIHLLTVGWLTLVAMGAIYYLVPLALNKQLFSEKLGHIHFWATNITMILAFILGITLTFAIDPLLVAKQPIPQAMGQVMPLPIVLDIVAYVGWIVQLLFAYNIVQTLRK